MLIKRLTVFCLAFSSIAHATFLPENNMKIPANGLKTGISEAQFNEVINKLERIYSPIIEEMGAKLKINREWENERVNATTTRTVDNKVWIINLFGGLARHPEVTPDSYLMVLCHELGHHLGGIPKKKRGDPPEAYWASTEGEADYFASLKCLRRIFYQEDNSKFLELENIPAEVKTSCFKSFKVAKNRAICIRSSLAGEASARMSATIHSRETPTFDKRDSTVVEVTYPEHPLPQCRLDSYFNGALCPSSFREPISEHNYFVGACYTGEVYTPGVRPFCWFKPEEGKPHQ